MDIGCTRGIRHRVGLPQEDRKQKTILELEKVRENSFNKKIIDSQFKL